MGGMTAPVSESGSQPECTARVPMEYLGWFEVEGRMDVLDMIKQCGQADQVREASLGD